MRCGNPTAWYVSSVRNIKISEISQGFSDSNVKLLFVSSAYPFWGHISYVMYVGT